MNKQWIKGAGDMDQVTQKVARFSAKFLHLFAALLILGALAACDTLASLPETVAEAEEAAVLPALPSFQKGELTTQNFGWVKCTGTNGQRMWCLGLQYGDGRFSGEVQWVKNLQQWLNYRGFNAGAVDGKFGSQTYNAVLRAQGWYGLTSNYCGTVSGRAGNSTWTSLFNDNRACARW